MIGGPTTLEQDHTTSSGDQGYTFPSPANLAREWARAIGATSSAPMPLAEIRDYLGDLAEQLVAALSGAAVDTQTASDVGARLVSGGFTGAQSLSRTFDALSEGLPAAARAAGMQPSCGRIIQLLGALAAGYTWALRNLIYDQQEEVKRALSSAWQDLEQDLRVSEAWFREVFDFSPVGIAIIKDDGRIVQTNRSLEKILGYSRGELLGRQLSELPVAGHQPIVEEHYRDLVAGRDSRFRVRLPLRRADGEPAWVYLAGSTLLKTKQASQQVVTMVEDITDQHLLEQRLHHQTLHDVQTGLPNRQYFVTHLETVLARLEPRAVVTLMHLDLDGFSTINDGLGHLAGDQLLDVVARRLEAVVAGRPAMVARLGADEYAILMEPEDPVIDVGAFAEIINTELAEPFYIDDIGVAATASIGVVQHQAGATTADDLMRAASTTLRRMRGAGKRQWTLFDADVDAAERAELRLAAAMPGAWETGELRVIYQPVVTLHGEQLVGIEAALSWQHPELGVLSHAQCVQAAEQTGAVHDVGQWLLRTAAEQAISWRQRSNASVPPVAINLTPSQAQHPDLVPRVTAALDETGLAPAELELRAPAAAIRTVSGELAGMGGARAEENMRELAKLGVRAGLHDFGGGIGALRCVADLGVCVVRIAQPISDQVAADPSRILSQAAQALVHIVRGAGIDVVAFPVDRAEQAACWPWIGANWAVGGLWPSVERWLNAKS
ncbi:MAG TPA: EAL domain-containing protein [Pseudonocardiaceae bacterium]|nr:EAL domain-containing protein [Pseudonocardiaceae bacterium]